MALITFRLSSKTYVPLSYLSVAQLLFFLCPAAVHLLLTLAFLVAATASAAKTVETMRVFHLCAWFNFLLLSIKLDSLKVLNSSGRPNVYICVMFLWCSIGVSYNGLLIIIIVTARKNNLLCRRATLNEFRLHIEHS